MPSMKASATKPTAMEKSRVQSSSQPPRAAAACSVTRDNENNYLQMFKASAGEQIDIIRKGLPAQTVAKTALDMGMTKDQLSILLRLSRVTINRQISKNKPLSTHFSERIIGLQKLIGQVESIAADSGLDPDFNGAQWLAHWLEQPLPALGNSKPAEYIDTVVGQKLVASMLARIQSGSYA